MSVGLIQKGPVVYRTSATAPKPPLPSKPPFEHASLITKATRLRRELKQWHRAGHPMTPRLERKRRAAICAACEYFNALGNFGMGECRAPGCGCTRAKTWLATSRCPLPEPKWDTVQGKH
jgi:hypothetical protein